MAGQIVLIGAGQTSASAARTLRRNGYDGRIVIIGDERHLPYQRPPLSKEYFVGESDLDELWSAPAKWYEENDVQLELGRHVLRIDRDSLDVELADGAKFQSDAVLIATGGRVRRFPGAEGEKINYLRTIEDANRIREKAAAGGRIVIVGGGFIGLEVAASARKMGADVVVIEALEAPLERVLGQEVGTVLGAIHQEQGVDLRCDTSVESISNTNSGVVVKTSDGEDIEGDMAVIGIGIEPNVEVAKATEITVGNGIRVDEFCRTAAEGIYAAGDVANHYHPLYDRRMRVEHFDNATRQGAVAARNMIGIRTQHDDPHWFWSDQYDHSLQYAGHVVRWDDIVVRGSVDDRDFVAFYLSAGKIAGAFGLNRGGDIMTVKSLLSARIQLDRNTLTDEDIDLEELVPQETEKAEPAPGAADTEDAADDGSFVRAARSGQVPEGIVRRFVVNGTEIAIARSMGKAYALHNLCTHLACHLASGKVDQGGLTCLCHGSIFDLATGEPINPPASRPVKTYRVRESDGQIFVSIE